MDVFVRKLTVLNFIVNVLLQGSSVRSNAHVLNAVMLKINWKLQEIPDFHEALKIV